MSVIIQNMQTTAIHRWTKCVIKHCISYNKQDHNFISLKTMFCAPEYNNHEQSCAAINFQILGTQTVKFHARMKGVWKIYERCMKVPLSALMKGQFCINAQKVKIRLINTELSCPCDRWGFKLRWQVDEFSCFIQY